MTPTATLRLDVWKEYYGVNKDQVRSAMREFGLRRGCCCVLCGSEHVHDVGSFLPREPWDFDDRAPAPGKYRVILYAICQPCFHGGPLNDVTDTVERVIRSDVERQRKDQRGGV